MMLAAELWVQLVSENAICSLYGGSNVRANQGHLHQKKVFSVSVRPAEIPAACSSCSWATS